MLIMERGGSLHGSGDLQSITLRIRVDLHVFLFMIRVESTRSELDRVLTLNRTSTRTLDDHLIAFHTKLLDDVQAIQIEIMEVCVNAVDEVPAAQDLRCFKAESDLISHVTGQHRKCPFDTRSISKSGSVQDRICDYIELAMFPIKNHVGSLADDPQDVVEHLVGLHFDFISGSNFYAPNHKSTMTKASARLIRATL